jgi:cyanate permease
MYPICSYLASYLLIKIGLYKTNFIGVILMVFGAAIRLFINYNFNFLLIGTIFAGAAKPIIYNSQNNFIKNWFGVKER